MAICAGKLFPVVSGRWLRFKVRILPVAVAAGGCDVPSSKDKSRLVMFGESESGRTVSVQGVTTLAGVKVGSRGELTGMLIAVAIGAMLKLDLEQCVLALGGMALVASHGCMLALQRISGCRVVFDRKR